MGLRNVLKNQRLAKSISFFCIMSMLIGMSNLIFSNVLAADSYEPDNSYSQASTISTDGTMQSHTFDPAGDEDWLVFTATLDQYYIIETHNLGDADTVLYLYDSDGTTLLESDDDGGEGVASKIAWTAPSNDNFYLKVVEWWGEGGPTYTYDINVTESVPPPPDAYEPDDTYSEATFLPVDESIQTHTFHVDGDEDWFIFTAVMDMLYIIDTFNYASAMPYLRLYDSDGTTFLESGFTQIDWVAPRDDDFYVQCTDLLGGSGWDYYYDINASESIPPPPDAYEPDNSPAEATSIPVDGTVQSHNFNVPDDEDWLIFSTIADYVYTISTSNLGSSFPYLQIYDSDGTTFLASGFIEMEWQSPRNDNFYVRVTEFWGSYGSAYTYDINITEAVPPPPDDYEPDDTYQEASSISTDGAMQSHTFHVAGDEDWVIFSATEDYLYTIETHNLGDADTVIYLYDSDGTTLIDMDDNGGVGSASLIEWYTQVSDDFYVEIVEDWGGGGPEYTYDINIVEQAPPPPDIYEPDDTYQEATSIPTDSTTQSHNFNVPDDEDWLIISATEGNLYEIETLNIGDSIPIIEIFDSDGVTWLVMDNAYGNSFTAPRTDSFYIRVTEYWGDSGEEYTYDIFITETAPPGVPRNFMITSGLGIIDLTWEPPSSDGGAPVTNYTIYRDTTPGQDTLLAVIGNQLFYSDNNVSNGVVYYYRVSAVNMVGEGTKTDEIQATPATYPTEPGNLETLVGDQFINLSWLAPQSDGGLPILKYNIYRGEDPEQKTLLEVDFGNLTYYNDTGLTNGVVYFYNISAINGVGEGPLSSEINATPVTVPSKPRNLEMSSGDSYVNLSWKEPSSDGGTPITNYIIFKSKTSGELEFLKEIDDLRYYNDTKVTNGETYYYQVCAVNDVDEGERTQEMQTNPLTTPTQPRNIQDFFGDSYVLLTWSVPISSGGSPITNYVIYRRTSSHGDTLRTEIGNVTEYNDTSVTNGVTYYYNISAKNDKGEGLLSNQVTVKPYTIPSEPKYLIVQAENDYINLSWDEPDEDGGSPVTAYVIYRGTVQGEEEYLKEIDNITFYDDDDIEGDKTYYYKVCAINDAGTGLHSEGISITSNAEEGELPMLWIILIVVIVIILASAVGAMTVRSKKKKRSQEQPQMTAFESQPEWEQPAQTFTMEPEPEPVFEPQAFAPTPVPAMTPSQLIRATYKCPNCTRMFTTENPIQATVVSCPACNKQTIILPQ